MQRTTNGDDVEVQYYLPPYHKYYMISEKDCTKGITIHCLYHNNSLCLKWATRRNKRIGSFFIFKDDSTFYKGYWDGDDNHVSRIILDDCQHQAIAEVDMKRGGIQYRGGYDPSLRIRVGWGCEYDPVTGLPLQCGIYENNKIVKEWKVFHDSVMTEYASKNPSSVVYIGEYANDYLNKYPRHGKGKELDPSNGIVIWEGRWKWDRKLKDVTMVVNNLNERSRMVSSITSLILPAKTGEKERISILSFSSFYNLEMIDIGEGCFPHVRDFQCCGLPFLQSLHVGKNAFCQLVNGWPRVCKYKTCTIMNNPLLTQITFEPFAFADFYVFTLKGLVVNQCSFLDLDKLEKLVIGDCSEDSFNFVHCPNLSLRCLPSLQRVSLGRHSFQYQELTLFHSMIV